MKQLFRIEHSHTITDVYYVEAENKEEASEKFLGEVLGNEEPDDTIEIENSSNISVIKW